MFHSFRLLLPVLVIACTGLFTTRSPAQALAQQIATPASAAETDTAQKLINEIQLKLFPLQFKTPPNIFSRRDLPLHDSFQADVVLLSAAEADLVPLQIAIKRGKDKPTQFVSGRYHRKKKRLELKYQPLKGEAEWLEPVKWQLKSRPLS